MPQWLRVSATQWRRSDGSVGGILLSIEDVSAERLLRKQLAAKDSILTTLFEVIQVGIAIADEDGRFLYANSAYRELVGHSNEDLAGMFVGSAMHPDDAPQAFDVLEPVLSGGVAVGEWRSRFTRRDGEVVLLDCVIASIPAAAGRRERFAVICRDATERSDLERRIRESDRLSAIGLLGEALAHDLGNLLPAFLGAVAGIRHAMLPVAATAATAAASTGFAGVEVVSHGTEYLQQLVDGLELLAVDPGGPVDPPMQASAPPNPPGTDVGAWWDKAFVLLRGAIPRSVALKARLDPELPRVRVGAGSLTQIALNVVLNGAEAVAERHERRGGSITIEVRREPTGERIAIVFTDDGAGMDRATLRRASARGTTTRRASGGWGIGLSLVERIAREHGGALHLESTPGKGTSVTVLLPAAAG